MAGSTDTVRRPGFKFPAPLNTADEPIEKGIWSPSHRSSSIVANGDFRSNSPRTTPPPSSLLATQVSHRSSLGSPKAATPNKFEDPLLSMPSFRKSGASPTMEPSFSTPLTASPSFKAGLASSGSFSDRHTGIDFRRSVPGGAGSPAGEPLASRGVVPRHHSLSRGASDYGDFTPYASPTVGSEPGLREDDEEATEQDVDVALQLVGRRHSTLTARDAPSHSASPSGMASPASARYSMHASEDDEFMRRLHQNRSSWRERSRVGSCGHATLSGGGSSAEGLQNKTHAALQQLRGELKSLSMRTLPGTQPVAAAGGATAAVGAAAGSGCTGGGASAAAAAAMAAAATAAAATADATHAGCVAEPSGSAPSGLAFPWSGSGSGGGASLHSRYSESHVQLSPSRLAISHHYSSTGGEAEDAPHPTSSLPGVAAGAR